MYQVVVEYALGRAFTAKPIDFAKTLLHAILVEPAHMVCSVPCYKPVQRRFLCIPILVILATGVSLSLLEILHDKNELKSIGTPEPTPYPGMPGQTPYPNNPTQTALQTPTSASLQTSTSLQTSISTPSGPPHWLNVDSNTPCRTFQHLDATATNLEVLYDFKKAGHNDSTGNMLGAYFSRRTAIHYAGLPMQHTPCDATYVSVMCELARHRIPASPRNVARLSQVCGHHHDHSIHVIKYYYHSSAVADDIHYDDHHYDDHHHH